MSVLGSATSKGYWRLLPCPDKIFSMRCVFRHGLVLLIALALVASGATSRLCVAMQWTAAAAAVAEHSPHVTGHAADAAGHAGHDHHAIHHQHGANEPAPPPDDDHGCMKCCSMCAAAHATLPMIFAAVTSTVASSAFSADADPWFGNIIRVDPGIPKRIA